MDIKTRQREINKLIKRALEATKQCDLKTSAVYFGVTETQLELLLTEVRAMREIAQQGENA